MIPLMQFFLGLMMLVMGIEQIKANKKNSGYICIITSGFIFIAIFLTLFS
jgi:hypothetical protein